MRTRRFGGLLLAALVMSIPAFVASGVPPFGHVQPAHALVSAPDPKPGIYQVWGHDSDVQSLPYVVGGQVKVEWRDIEPIRGRWNWTSLDSKLALYKSMGKQATVQVNSTTRPAWVASLIATCNNSFPQYWDPGYVQLQDALITALAAHLKASPYRSVVALVRASPNAIGTELTDVPAGYQCTPATNGRIWNEPWSVAVGQNYYKTVMGLYRTRMSPELHFALRAQLFTTNAVTPPLEWLGVDDAWIMQTASDIDPNPLRDAFDVFAVNWARAGKTEGYIEPHHTNGKSHLVSWNYWRLLHELNKGVSYLAVYGEQIAAGRTNTEYSGAFDFANQYAGSHARPLTAPGAWVALKYGYGKTAGNLTRFMTQVDPEGTSTALDSKQGTAVIGPATQKYGRFARQITAGTTKNRMTFQLNPTFRSGLAASTTRLRVIYLDSAPATFQVRWGTASSAVTTVRTAGSGLWRSAFVTVPGTSYAGQLPGAGDISVTATAGTSIFHMVEVTVGGR